MQIQVKNVLKLRVLRFTEEVFLLTSHFCTVKNLLKKILKPGQNILEILVGKYLFSKAAMLKTIKKMITF